jgi:lipid-binding SYLF domain-containing protein
MRAPSWPTTLALSSPTATSPARTTPPPQGKEQAGAQTAGLAMFFMREDALTALQNAGGWEIGTGPSVVMLEAGLQANVTTTTLAEPVYAISFGQQGLIAGATLAGVKYSRIIP